MTSDLRTYTLERTGRPPLEFEGECLATAYGDEYITDRKRRNPRWHELEVYRTKGGTYVLSVRYRTDWPGEVGHDETFAFPHASDVVAHLSAINPLAHVKGYPDGEYFARKQERLLAEVRARYDRCVSELFGGLGPEFAERIL